MPPVLEKQDALYRQEKVFGRFGISLAKGMTPRPVLVYDGELHPAVEATGFFDAVVPARKLLGK